MGIVGGCDVSKEWIDVGYAGAAPNQPSRVPNTSAALDRFARGLPAGSSVGMEATGQWHELLAAKLAKYGHTVFVINPRWIRLYARARGLRGKTDRTDAALIAHYVAVEGPHLHPYEPPSPAQRELRKLLLRRRTVVKLKASARQSLGASARELLGQFDRLLKDIDNRVAELIGNVPAWKDLLHRLKTEPGVGPVVAAHLVQVLTRIPFANAEAFIAHTGLDPRPNDSGQKHGRRRLTRHGDGALRTMLYLAAVTASRTSWRAYYQAQLAKGLPNTAAFIVVARKIARIAFSLFKTGAEYDPKRAPMSACIAT